MEFRIDYGETSMSDQLFNFQFFLYLWITLVIIFIGVRWLSNEKDN